MLNILTYSVIYTASFILLCIDDILMQLDTDLNDSK
jgi:hypothetical protein